MKKYKVFRTFVKSQYQIVEAEDELEAIEKAQENQKDFDVCMNSDDDWEYKAEEAQC